MFPHSSQCWERKIKSLSKRPPPSNLHHHGKWAQRNSSLPLIWGPMLMKLVINSSLCCRFLYCMCNQMWPSLGFTAINELRKCARGGERWAAGLGSGSGLAWRCVLVGRSSLAGVSRALGPGVPTSPQTPRLCLSPPGPSATAAVRRDPLPVAFPGIATLGALGWGGKLGEGEYRPFSLTLPPLY